LNLDRQTRNDYVEANFMIRQAAYVAVVALLCSPVLAASSGTIPDLSAGGAAWRNPRNDFIMPKTGAGQSLLTPISGPPSGHPRCLWRI